MFSDESSCHVPAGCTGLEFSDAPGILRFLKLTYRYVTSAALCSYSKQAGTDNNGLKVSFSCEIVIYDRQQQWMENTLPT